MDSRLSIAVFDASPDEMPTLRALSERGASDIRILGERLKPATLHLAAGCDAVSILGWSILDREMLRGLADLGVRFVSTRTVGCDHINLMAARELGIRVSHASYPPNAVADLTVMLMLVLLRNYKCSIWKANVNDFSLVGLKGRSIHQMTVGVWGAGKIGQQVLRNLSGFGCRLLACSRRPNPALAGLAELVSGDELLARSDIVSLHMPATPDTVRMINRDVLRRMKKGALLINTARAELMVLPDVIEALEDGQLGGLAMDVFEGENGIYHQNHGVEILKNRDMAYLRQLSNVLLTPHMGFYTGESIESMARTGIEGLEQMAHGTSALEVRCD